MGQTNDRNERSKAKSKKSVTAGGTYGKDEFIQLELSKEQEVVCKAWVVTPEQVWDYLEEMVSDGYKFTLKHDTYNHCAAVFCIPSTENANAGYILTGRGSRVWKAVKQLLFKHDHLLDGVWTAAASGKLGLEIDD